jgi:hypothetical protein
MVCFQSKNPNSGKFWRAFDGKMLRYSSAILNILRTLVILYDHLVHFVFIWYIFYGFGIICLEKSGNPGSGRSRHKEPFPKTSKNIRKKKPKQRMLQKWTRKGK